ncbi:MAG: alanine racemase [Ruminococcus sp.]|nr:alanine racemase [Ruminococcus sp.]
MNFSKRCYAKIDLSALRRNIENYRSFLNDKTQLMCVVKANCYGHDASVVVPYLESELGVKHFAVANLYEAQSLREMGIKGEILILGYTPHENADDLIASNVIQACTEPDYAQKLSKSATKGKVRLHIAIDTGMTRIGLHGSAKENADDIEKMLTLENLSIEGMFTHYAAADSDDEDNKAYTAMQTHRILDVDSELKKRGINIGKVHFLNSAGGVYCPDENSAFARLGIIMYGLYPDPATPLPFTPEPVMTLTSMVSQVKYISKGTCVSYGRTFTADKTIKLATVTAGYADGFPRALSNKGEVIIKGVRCPIVGRVCMDQFMCDVSALDDVQPGDEVTLFGKEITADDIAALAGTIGYEIVCGITARVPRIAVNA